MYDKIQPDTILKGRVFQLIKRAILKYSAVIFALFALCGAEVYGMRPCGAGFFAALIYSGVAAIAVLPAFIGFTLVFDLSLAALLYSVIVSVAVFTAAIIGLKFKRAKKAAYGSLFALSQFSLLFMSGKMNYAVMFVWGVFALGIFVAAVCFLKPVLVQNLKYKLLETELVCGGVLLICAALGLSHMKVYGFDLSYLLAAFFVPLAAAVGSVSCSVAVSMCFGAGISIAAMQLAPLAFMAFSALITSVFAKAPKPLASLAESASYVLISYLFSFPPSWQQLVCFALGSLAFSFIPERAVAKLRDMLFAPVTAMAARGIVNRAAAETGNELLGASRIFYDMQIAMQQIPESSDKASVLETGVCAHCSRYKECSEKSGFREALGKMERNSAVRGRASVSEIPTLLSECSNLSALVAGATDAAQKSHERIITDKAKREGRKVVSQQLGLMAGVLKQMGERVRIPVKFDSVKENKIAEELAYRDLTVPEVIVADDTVSVVVRGENVKSDELASVISKIMHAPYKYVRGGADVLPGYMLMLFCKAPRYDVAFSVAASAKEERSGDNHSFIRLGGDRFMMALCDGMGSGEEAEKASETAIELVESFFRAGLDSVSAAECVNRFLALNDCERFSTLDITVIDLNSGDAEIIKFSSPATVIKTTEGVRAVSGSALPVGVFEQAVCSLSRQKLKTGDEIIMATDGITDALGSTEKFMTAAAMQSASDPHIEAKNILDCAVANRNGKLGDDATVLCARIFEKG